MMKKLLLLLAVSVVSLTSLIRGDILLKNLNEGDRLGGFTVEALYLNGENAPVGARFRHEAGTVLDYFQIQTVPQAYIWFNTPPASDGGEPHTLEHVVLSKGNKGKYAAALEEMSLGMSSAFTQQFRTSYSMNTSAGVDIFYRLLETKIDSLLFPDYSREELRREVMNIGIKENPDGTLGVEEKGTIYAEMSSAFEKPNSLAYFRLTQNLFGQDDPRGRSSGGYPPAIRKVVPDDIITFHDRFYRTDNMGIILVMPGEVSLGDALNRTGTILKEKTLTPVSDIHPENRLDPLAGIDGKRPPVWEKVPFPAANANTPGMVLYAWRVPVKTAEEEIMLELFINGMFSGENSRMWEKLIDPQKRVTDTGANWVGAWYDSVTRTCYVMINNVRADYEIEKGMESLYRILVSDWDEFLSLEKESAGLSEFNDLMGVLIQEQVKEGKAILENPPRFGYRAIGSRWMNHLSLLHRMGGFHRELSMESLLNRIQKRLSSDPALFQRALGEWGVMSQRPFAVRTIPDPDYTARMDQEKQKRIRGYEEELKRRFHTDDLQTALISYQTEANRKTAEIEETEKAIRMPSFLSTPPLELDSSLRYEESTLPRGGRIFTAFFDQMETVTTALYYNLKTVPEEDYFYLSGLPEILYYAGLFIDGKEYPYEEIEKRLKKELLSFDIDFAGNSRTGRVELKVSASGRKGEEALGAVEWIRDMTEKTWLNEKNASRLADVISRSLSGTLDLMRQSKEEFWVHDPSTAFHTQENHLYLSCMSTLTRQYNLLRLKWRLKDFSGDKTDFFRDMNRIRKNLKAMSRDEFLASLQQMKAEQGGSDFSQAADDLLSLIPALPPGSWEKDTEMLVSTIEEELSVSPARAVREIRELTGGLRNRHLVRIVIAGNTGGVKEAGEAVKGLLKDYDTKKIKIKAPDSTPLVWSNIEHRLGAVSDKRFVALVNPDSTTGVHMNRASIHNIHAYTDEDIYRTLASKLLGGSGPRSLFMQTWRAGLAYSNGFNASLESGVVNYYAERCPDLTQTMAFVQETLAQTPADPELLKGVLPSFFYTIEAGGFVDRAQTMAGLLTDGSNPGLFRKFRERVLALSQQKDFQEETFRYINDWASLVVPGLRPDIHFAGTVYIIANDEQALRYEEYLKKEIHAPGIIKIYPRDYWAVSL